MIQKTRPSTRKKKNLAIAGIGLLAIVVGVVWQQRGAEGVRGEARPAISAPAEVHTRTENVTSGNTLRLRDLVREDVTGVSVVDDSLEEFLRVPVWVPRPVDARSAKVVSASLRSDGYAQGVLEWVYPADNKEARKHLAAALEAAGLQADAGATLFTSQRPAKRCELHQEFLADGAQLFRLFYQGSQHENGCGCPTCQSPH